MRRANQPYMPFYFGGVALLLFSLCPLSAAAEEVRARVVEAAPRLQAQPSVRPVKEDDFIPAGRREPPAPMHFRGFRLYPALEVRQSYTDNLYATPNDEQDAWITQTTPSLYVTKEFGRHSADVLLEADVRHHWSQPDEDLANVRARLGGMLEGRHDLHFPLEVHYESGHEERLQNLSADISRKPIGFRRIGASAGAVYRPNRLGIRLMGHYAGLSFENGVSALSGLDINRSYANRHKFGGDLTLEYELGPNHKPFITLGLDRTVYPYSEYLSATNMSALAGWELSYKGLLRARIAGGLGRRDYIDESMKDIGTMRAAASLDWNVTRYATLKLAYERALLEDNDVLAGVRDDTLRLGLDYELTRRILLTAYVQQSWLDYENSPRRDDIVGGGFGMRYVFDPYHSVSAEYTHDERDSTSPGIDHGKDTFVIRYNMNF